VTAASSGAAIAPGANALEENRRKRGGRIPGKDYSTVPLTSKLGAKPGAEVTVFFTTRADELRRRFPKLKRTLGPQDGLWVAWPKKASRIETDLTFDEVQRIGLENGLVDNKSAAVDDAWQAVRFVYRVADRPR
jgi:hypothetical protein